MSVGVRESRKRNERRGEGRYRHILLVEAKDRVPSPEAGEMLAGRSFLLHGRVFFSPVAAVVCISLFTRGFSPEVIGCHSSCAVDPANEMRAETPPALVEVAQGLEAWRREGGVMRCLCGGLAEDGLGPDA
jgi:hypothetical protein